MRRESCVGCSSIFEYEIKGAASGGGHSSFLLNNAGAEVSAESRARANLIRALDEAIEPVHCPKCGIFQPKMVQVLRERHLFASERIAVPTASAWRTASSANTRESYNKFKQVWPTFSRYADERAKELRYPPYLRKLMSSFYWIAWALVAVSFVLLMGLSILGDSKYLG
jgi:hypothetical protein